MMRPVVMDVARAACRIRGTGAPQMKDLTRGSVGGHVLQLATFIALTTTFQTLYFLADLYFVGRLGKEAIAGVGLAGNLSFLVLALTQSLGVGATSLIAQAIGRKQREQAERVLNQALVLSTLTGLAFGSSPSRCAAPTAAGSPPTPPRPRPGSSTSTGSCPRCRCSSRSWRWGRPCAAWAT